MVSRVEHIVQNRVCPGECWCWSRPAVRQLVVDTRPGSAAVGSEQADDAVRTLPMSRQIGAADGKCGVEGVHGGVPRRANDSLARWRAAGFGQIIPEYRQKQ